MLNTNNGMDVNICEKHDSDGILINYLFEVERTETPNTELFRGSRKRCAVSE